MVQSTEDPIMKTRIRQETAPLRTRSGAQPPLTKRPAILLPAKNRITDRPEVKDIVSNDRPSGVRPRRTGRPVPGRPTEAERRERRRLWLFVLFMLALLVPGSFFIGTARLSPYRAFLLLAVLPLLWQVARGALGRLTSIDVLFVCYALWLALATLVNEGIERYQFVVVLTIEALCGYLFGRVLVRNVSDYKTLMRVLLGQPADPDPLSHRRDADQAEHHQ